MASPLGLNRFNINKPDAGILRVVSGAIVTVYNTNSDGTAAVTSEGVVNAGAVKSTLYADRDQAITKNNPVTADSQGLIEFYVDKLEVHILIVAPDGTTYGIPWFPIVRPPVEASSVVYPTDLQAAVDSTPEGGILKLGPGIYTAPDGGLLISKGIDFSGAGSRATVLRPYSNAVNQPVIKFLTEEAASPTGPTSVNNVYLHDFEIRGLAAEPDNAPDRSVGSYGIQIITFPTGFGQRIRDVFLERLNVNHMGDSGLHVTGDGAGSAVIGLRVSSCQFNQNWGFGVFIQGATLVCTTSILCASNYLDGGRFESCSPSCINDYYEDNCHSNDAGLTLEGYNGQVSFFSGIVNAIGITVEAFTKNTGSAYLQQPITKTGMTIHGCSGFISGCRFYNATLSGVADERGIFIDNKDGKSSILIGPNQFDRLYIAIAVNGEGTSNGTVKTFILPQRVFGGDGFILQSGGIVVTALTSGEIPASLDASAKGQLIYNTVTNKLNFWDGTAWRVVTST